MLKIVQEQHKSEVGRELLRATECGPRVISTTEGMQANGRVVLGLRRERRRKLLVEKT